MSKVRVYVTGEAGQRLKSKATGKEFIITNVFVYTGGKPFPEAVGVIGDVQLAQGDYMVPVSLSVYQNRLQVDLQFDKAEVYKG